MLSQDKFTKLLVAATGSADFSIMTGQALGKSEILTNEEETISSVTEDNGEVVIRLFNGQAFRLSIKESFLFSDLINFSKDPKATLQKVWDSINNACLRHPNSARDSGVLNPSKVNEDPFKVLKVELEDRDYGWALVKGCGVEVKIVFSPDEDVYEWMNEALEEFPSGL